MRKGHIVFGVDPISIRYCGDLVWDRSWSIFNTGFCLLHEWQGITISCFYFSSGFQVGGATARIGDPSGKTHDRDKLASETVDANTVGIMENIDRIFTNHQKYLWKVPKDLRPLK